MREPSTLLLCLTAIILVVRAPYALNSTAARPGWLAGALGLLAVICLGFLIPVPALDTVLGSAGYWNILGSTSTTLSFHFMYQAILIHTSRPLPRYYLCGLLFALAASSASFGFIRGRQEEFESVEEFIATLISQPWTAIYLSIYLGTVAAISCLSFHAVWKTSPRTKTFLTGFILVVLGNVTDIGLLWLQYTRVVDPTIPAFLYKVYIGLFFSGVIALCVGFLRGSLSSLIRYQQFVYYAFRIRKILSRTGTNTPDTAAIFMDPRNSCYQGLILVRDFMTLGGFILNGEELALTRKADELLTDFPLPTSPTR